MEIKLRTLVRNIVLASVVKFRILYLGKLLKGFVFGLGFGGSLIAHYLENRLSDIYKTFTDC